jgi:AcrR family transcriptional regulator
MRRIAAKLGAGTMSLYWHISSKQDLFDLMLDAALGEIELPERPSRDWRSDLCLVAMQMRTVLLHHPWLTALFDSRPPLGPNGLRYSEFSLAAIDGLGLDFFTMKRVLDTVNSYVLGFVLNTAAEEEARRRSGMSEQEWQAAIEPYLRQVFAGGQYPILARRIYEEEESGDKEANFAFGLDCVLDGIAARISTLHPGKR